MHRHVTATRDGGLVEAPRVWDAPELRIKVRRVCSSCNNGWMSDLESEAEPLLSPLIFSPNTYGLFSATESRTLAFWISKTMLMFQFVNWEGATVPHSWFLHLRERHNPPPGMH